MAIFYCQSTPISRSKGRSATAAAGYRAAEKIMDDRTGVLHDFTRKKGVLDTFIFNNEGLSRSELWNLAELSEKRSDSRVAREWQLALPHELKRDSHQRIIKGFSQALIDRYGVAIDVCVHAPGRGKDHRNIHAHLLMTTRPILASGELGREKTQLEWSDTKLRKNGLPTGREQLESIREQWASIVNQELESAGLSERISHLSLKEQGITNKIPQIHVGPLDTQLARMGYTDRATRWQVNELIKQANNIIDIGSTHQDVRSLKMKQVEKATELPANSIHHGGLASSLDDAEKAENLPITKPQNQDVEEHWKPVEIDPAKGRVINMFRADVNGVYRWGAGKAKGEEAFRDTGKTIYSQSISEWALAAELELAQDKVKNGEWKEIRAFGDEEYRRRIWAQGQMMGIEVKGYKPTPEELERFKPKLPENGLAADAKSVPEKPEKQFEDDAKFRSTIDARNNTEDARVQQDAGKSRSPKM